MEKEQADGVITEYMKKIYGFALSKTMDIDKAEELASRITFEVYKSLLKTDNIHNVNSYIYRTSQNVYNRFMIEEINENQNLFKEPHTIYDQDIKEDIVYQQIRSKISYLSNLQREIVVMHYFDKLSLKEIAEKLKIPHGTVRWHLFEAKKQLIDEFHESNVGSANSEQIFFNEIKYMGYSSPLNIEIPFYFSTLLSQNIAFLSYHKAKTSIEIAKELEVPVVFVEDEINHLVDNGFMIKKPGNTYLTNIYINDLQKEKECDIDVILNKYAKIVCEKYIPLLFKLGKDFIGSLQKNIYSPENDLNFLMWSIVSYACLKKLVIRDNSEKLEKFMIKRKDGGQNIVFAKVSTPFNQDISNQSKDKDTFINKDTYKIGRKYIDVPGWQFDTIIKIPKYVDMMMFSQSKKIYQMKTWLFSSHFDERGEDFTVWTNKLYETLYDFMSGKLTKEVSNIDKYMKLFDKSLIISKGNSEFVNMVITTMSAIDFENMLPEITDELKTIGQELDREMYKINKKYFPKHIQNLCRIINQNSLSKGQIRYRILENLLKKGDLQPIKNYQKQTVNMILFNDILPIRDS